MNATPRLVKDGSFWRWAFVADDLSIDMIEPEEIAPAPPVPEIPAEVHNTRPIDSEVAWAAVVACCKGA